jgi:hypothetical protein
MSAFGVDPEIFERSRQRPRSKLLARNNSVSREHKTFDAVNFICA